MSTTAAPSGALVQGQSVTLDAVEAPVVRRSDVVVVGGGPAGVSAAVSAARSGASVTLLERYSALGGLASGGMVLVLDDMINGDEITVTGIVDEYVERMAKLGLAVYPPAEERVSSQEMWNKWGRWGAFDFHSHTSPKPICYAVAFDPDGWKRVSNDLVRESGVDLRLHSWFSRPIVQDGAVKGVVCETKSGPQAVMGDVVIDTTGDIDVASRAGATYDTGQLPRHPGLPARRRRHRGRGALRAGEPARGPRDQPQDQAAARRRLGAVVAQDARTRCGVVQRPAHDRLRRHRPGVAHRGRVRGAEPYRQRARPHPVGPAGLRECVPARRRRADGCPPDPSAAGRVRRHQGRRHLPSPLRRQCLARP